MLNLKESINFNHEMIYNLNTRACQNFVQPNPFSRIWLEYVYNINTRKITVIYIVLNLTYCKLIGWKHLLKYFSACSIKPRVGHKPYYLALIPIERLSYWQRKLLPQPPSVIDVAFVYSAGLFDLHRLLTRWNELYSLSWLRNSNSISTETLTIITIPNKFLAKYEFNISL